MATKVSDVSKAGKAATAVAGSNGAAVATTKVKPLPAKVLRNLTALGEPYRLAVLGFAAAAAGPVMLAEIVDHLVTQNLTGDFELATQAVNHLKQKGWLIGERVPKGDGGGWRYRLSDAGRERLMAMGG